MSAQSEGMPFSVGAVGPAELTGARKVLLRASISRVLREVAAGIAPLMNLRAQPGSEVTRPRIVNGLTGDADLLVAEEGLAAGYELFLILSRPRAEHLATLGPALETRAQRAIDQAREISEPASLFGASALGVEEPPQMLGGPPDTRSRLLMMSDVLACIWDGVSTEGRDTPGAVAVAAAEQGVPVVQINSAPPHDIRLYGLGEPPSQSWNRILPPDVLERLERMASAPEAEDSSTLS